MHLVNKGANSTMSNLFSINIDNWWNSKIINRKKWEELKTNRCEICNNIIVVKPVCSNLEKMSKLSKYGKGNLNMCALCCYHSNMLMRRNKGTVFQYLYSVQYFRLVLNKRLGYNHQHINKNILGGII